MKAGSSECPISGQTPAPAYRNAITVGSVSIGRDTGTPWRSAVGPGQVQEALVQTLQRRTPKSKLSVAPIQVDGVWCLELTYQGDEAAGVPDHWHGHRVVLRKLEPPPSA